MWSLYKRSLLLNTFIEIIIRINDLRIRFCSIMKSARDTIIWIKALFSILFLYIMNSEKSHKVQIFNKQITLPKHFIVKNIIHFRQLHLFSLNYTDFYEYGYVLDHPSFYYFTYYDYDAKIKTAHLLYFNLKHLINLQSTMEVAILTPIR